MKEGATHKIQNKANRPYGVVPVKTGIQIIGSKMHFYQTNPIDRLNLSSRPPSRDPVLSKQTHFFSVALCAARWQKIQNKANFVFRLWSLCYGLFTKQTQIDWQASRSRKCGSVII